MTDNRAPAIVGWDEVAVVVEVEPSALDEGPDRRLRKPRPVLNEVVCRLADVPQGVKIPRTWWRRRNLLDAGCEKVECIGAVAQMVVVHARVALGIWVRPRSVPGVRHREEVVDTPLGFRKHVHRVLRAGWLAKRRGVTPVIANRAESSGW